jgi:hypothetical protein
VRCLTPRNGAGAAEHSPPSPSTIEAHQKKARAGIAPFAAFDPSASPAREWMYGRHFQRGTVSLTVGTGGRGKTSLVLVEVIAMALCEMLLGEMPTSRFRAWVHCGEDDMNELLRRVAAICQRYKLSMKDLEGWLFLTSAHEFPLRVAEGYNELKIDNALIAHITSERRFCNSDRTASDLSGKNYAPMLFAQEREAKDARVGRAALEEAMRRLFAVGRIRVTSWAPAAVPNIGSNRRDTSCTHSSALVSLVRCASKKSPGPAPRARLPSPLESN